MPEARRVPYEPLASAPPTKLSWNDLINSEISMEPLDIRDIGAHLEEMARPSPGFYYEITTTEQTTSPRYYTTSYGSTRPKSYEPEWDSGVYPDTTHGRIILALSKSVEECQKKCKLINEAINAMHTKTIADYKPRDHAFVERVMKHGDVEWFSVVVVLTDIEIVTIFAMLNSETMEL